MNKFKKRKLFTENLMWWNAEHNKRIMPWKGEKDPYKIWLSEIILQQTRVEQGLEYYQRFIKKYPKIQLLAAASGNEVFKLWEGLGYYSRCKNLIATAKIITEDYAGIFPKKYDDILDLKGIGPYTAAAISSFAFNLPYAVVDGNVLRVIARFFGIDTAIDSSEGKKQFTSLAQTLIDKASPASYNQAIMDFGATICKPQLPLCEACVFKKSCAAFKENLIKQLPVKEKKLIKKHRYFYYIIAEYKEKIYVKKRIESDIWQNLWEFILVEKTQKIPPEKFLISEDFKSLFKEIKEKKVLGVFCKQQLTHQTIEGIFIYVVCTQPFINDSYIMINKSDISNIAFPRLITNFFEKHPYFKL
jgi:A/G-specific adenine glycosylase